jgi:hypothetical protein
MATYDEAMYERFDETELLALIEDDLDPQEARRLRRRLASHPEVLARIERMREDRMLLRTVPEPRLPEGLLAELEPILARPMLMPDAPSRRRSRRPVLRAVAAAVALIAFAGVWATIIGVVTSTSKQENPIELARSGPADAGAVGLPAPETATAVANDDSWPPQGSVVHHYAPVAAGAGDTRVARERSRPVGGRPGGPALVAADFMLVVKARDDAEAEGVLRRVLSELAGESALVRNFTYEEAQALGESIELAEGARRGDAADTDTPVADVSGEAAGPRRRTDRDAPGPPRPRAQDRPETRLSRSAVIVGPRILAPSFERQLDFSERGAAYTLSVPADRLMQVLAQLQLREQRQTGLRVEVDPAADEAPDELLWLRQWPMVRRAAEALSREGDGAVVLLPVVVEESD